MSQDVPETPNGGAPGRDEIDDLFDLDQTATGFRSELEAALTAVDHAKQALGVEVAATEPTPRSIKPVQPVVAPAPTPDANVLDRALALTAPRKPSNTRIAIALVAALVLINVLLVVAMTHANASLADAVATMGKTAKNSQPEPTAAAPTTNPTPQRTSELPEGYHTLDLAQADMERGDHAFARRRLFSLLAVVDGVQEPARTDIEARAGLAVGDSYRLQAETLAEHTKGGSR